MSALIETEAIATDTGADDDAVDTTANRRIRRRVVDGVLYTVGLVIFLGLAWCLWPVRWGGTFAEVVVSGHSMEPVFHTGDLVVTKKSDHYRIGQKVVYTIPKHQPGAGVHVVHRIIGVRPDGTFVMQGDNRNTPDDWRPTSHDVVGRVVAVIPQAGRALLWLAQPLVLATLAGLIITVWLWPEREVRRPAPIESDPLDEAEVMAPAGAVVIEHVPFSSPRVGPWWADEVPDFRAIDEQRGDHVMPSAPSSSEWDEITTSASASSDSSS
jgi:signal peptidase